MIPRIVMAAFLLTGALLAGQRQVARAGILQISVAGAPTSIAAVDAPGVLAMGLNFAQDFSPSVAPGEYYVVATVAITNGGSVPFAYSPLDFTLENVETGVIRPPSLTYPTPDPQLLQSGVLAPGATVVGDVPFLVTLSESIFAVHWSHSPNILPFPPDP